MSAYEILKAVIGVTALMVTAPVIALIVRLSVFLGGMKTAIETAIILGKKLEAKFDAQSEMSADHETRISVIEAEAKIDRRSGYDRRVEQQRGAP